VNRLAAFDASDRSRRTREEVLNSLEAFTYRSRDYLSDESFIGASIDAVRSTLEDKLSAASEWIYSEGAEASEKDLRARLKELEDIVNPVLKRKTEASKRPNLIKEVKETIAHLKDVIKLVDGQIQTQIRDSSLSSEAVSKASATPSTTSSADSLDDLEEGDAQASASEPAEPEITEVPTIYTDADMKTLEELMSSAQKWLDENEAKQAKLGPTDDPAFTAKELEAEKKRMDDVIMEMMMKKMKHFKPPQDEKPKAKPKPKPKAKKEPKKKANKKDKKSAAKEDKPIPEPQVEENREEPSQEELDEALRKAGIKADNIKLKSFGFKDEIQDEQGRKLKKLNINEDSTEDDIKRAIDELTSEAAKAKKHDEL
jgi:hypoxia up-regulated 1